MAERRMFAKTIIDSDAFLDMPLSAQALYFHLSMRADDDGFINNPKKIQRMIGASDDDCKLLILKRFIITFESGVIVIKHWRIHNYIQKDRYKPTIYQEEKSQLAVKENKAYTECIHNGYNLDTQDRLELGKDRLELEQGKDIDSISKAKKPVRHKYGEYKNVLLSDEDMKKLQEEFPADYQERIERLSGYIASTGKSYKNHLATIRNWARKDKEQKPTYQGKQQQSGNVFLDIAKENGLI
jgi:hypothetical protein|nr:MAG TPA: replisome organizer [Caudoviricetes sp.]